MATPENTALSKQKDDGIWVVAWDQAHKCSTT